MAIVVSSSSSNVYDLTKLKTSIGKWTHRSDLADIYDDLITLAEARINGDLDARLQDSLSDIVTVANSEIVAMPDDVINIRSIFVDSSQQVTLKYVTPDQFRSLYPYDTSGVPNVYTVIGGNIHLAPIPDGVYTMPITYKAKVPPLSTFNTSNWLLRTYPNVYLYAVLLECAPYIKDDARLQTWKAAYDLAIESVNHQDWYSGSTMTIRTDIRP